MLASQMPNCARIGLSRPRLARMRAICSVLAASPARIAAGSPGARRSTMNTSTATMSSTGIVAAKRRRMKFSMKKNGPGQGPFQAAPEPSILLQVPVDIAIGDEEAADVLPRGHRLRVLAQRHVRADLESACLQRFGHLLFLRRVGLAH